MMQSLRPAPVIVIDASFTIWVILPVMASGRDATDILAGWYRQNRRIVAPEIWLPETVSVIRQGIYTGLISKDEGQVAVDDVFALGVEVILTDRSLGKSALNWADQLGQSKAYDAFYLALAEQSKSEFWTADKRLANGARQLGATWAHWIGEEIGDIS